MNLIGALLIVSASFFVGMRLAHFEGESLKTVEALLDFLRFMRRRIAVERRPITSIFSEYEDEFLENSGFFEAFFCSRGMASERFGVALSVLKLEQDMRTELDRFASELGTLPLESQLSGLDGVISCLGDARDRLREILPAKQKSERTVCLLAGLMTAILLI